MMGIKRAAFLAATVLAAPSGAHAAAPPSLQATLTATLEAARAASHTPGTAATITRGGAVVWSAATGRGDVGANLPFLRASLSSVASVTKMVTATIVLRMAEDGLLSIDSPIAPYLPASIPGVRDVTIRDLLGMRSGYVDIENSPQFIAATEDPNHLWTRGQFYAAITPPRFAPGTREEYCNLNFLLLSAIVDKVYPGGMAAAFETYVSKPAGLGANVVFRRDPRVAYRFAHGYQRALGHPRDVSAGAKYLGVNTSVWGTIWGDGGIGATAEGLARFADALYGGKLVQPATLAAMEAPLQIGNYGLGMEHFVLDGHDWYGHVGAFNGYTAMLLHDVARDVTIVGVANALDVKGTQNGIIFALVAAYDSAAPAQ